MHSTALILLLKILLLNTKISPWLLIYRQPIAKFKNNVIEVENSAFTIADSDLKFNGEYY